MKLKTTIAALAGVFLAASSFAQTVTFNNTPSQAVIDSRTGEPVGVGVAVAGLYFSTDLTATPDPTVPSDDFLLAATTPVSPNPIFLGVYSGGTVTIESLAEGQDILFQVRAWSVGFENYAAALASGDSAVLVGTSNTGVLKLGGPGGTPTPATSSFVQSFDITPVPEPSTVVLGLLGGLGAMVLLRRRK